LALLDLIGQFSDRSNLESNRFRGFRSEVFQVVIIGSTRHLLLLPWLIGSREPSGPPSQVSTSRLEQCFELNATILTMFVTCALQNSKLYYFQIIQCLQATLISLPNSNRFHLGYFETPSVHELKSRCQLSNQINAIRFENITGDVRALHESQPNAVFQVASQFNALEMVNYDVTPEDGVTGYAVRIDQENISISSCCNYLNFLSSQFDRTQGPACALCCPAATVYRNYLVNGMGQGGLGSQLDLLSDVAALVGNTENEYWYHSHSS
jgi:hypothetical protein